MSTFSVAYGMGEPFLIEAKDATEAVAQAVIELAQVGIIVYDPEAELDVALI